ncbi:hypothetical protein [Fusobacterium vincentii ATCC 49256]|jgi:hypothetical protein|uniref:Uncharacterized protein n=1 Tax=Fusobacterium vincentii ATCC 49256 TaxID=209882 RepID=Q7P8D7_FUSVC|nr:hypothetical protein [Fusobacterium nucleatum]EAA25219.1 hypothetical protein [Fusobacterium vincentii ATCC 49256]WDF25871.1 hypothetical protein PSC67_05060 [Fusobacterium nucleatum]DAQ12375.1 MAG TPA: hypothetical protein [Caudoviricetes sp.]
MIDKKTLIEKAEGIIKYNESLINDDAAVAMLGISRVVSLKKENEELKIFIKVFNKLV